MARAAGQQKLCCLRIPHPPQQNRHAEILPAQVHSLSCVRIPQPPHRQRHPKFFPALENSARPLRGSERWQKSMGIFQEGLRRRVAECISVPLNCPHATKHPHALPHKSNACYRGSQGDPHRQRQRRVERPDQSSLRAYDSMPVPKQSGCTSRPGLCDRWRLRRSKSSMAKTC